MSDAARPPDPLPVELLATDDQRRLSEAIDTAKPLPQSDLEECWAYAERLATGIRGPARTRGRSEVNRVLSILDELDGKDGAR